MFVIPFGKQEIMDRVYNHFGMEPTISCLYTVCSFSDLLDMIPEEVDMEPIRHASIVTKNGIPYCSKCGESLSVPVRKRCGECGSYLDLDKI